VINFCTVSDKNYLIRGLTLFRSLKQTVQKDFKLHYLCMDKKSYLVIKGLDDQRVIPYSLDKFIENDIDLKKLKDDGDHKYLSFCLSSYFSNYLLNNLDIDSINYIDSDIYFHKDFKLILDEIGDKDVGIFRHRQYPTNIPNGNGWFNVGVLHFKNTEVGKNALEWWYDAVLYKKYPELATCGDQRYLDAFIELSDHLFIDGNIGHGAPWLWQLYNYSQYEQFKSIGYYGKLQPLIFSHFSQFEYNIKENTYIPSTMHHCFTPLEMYEENVALKSIYDNYFEEIKRTVKEFKIRI
jgi:hypothetical protein